MKETPLPLCRRISVQIPDKRQPGKMITPVPAPETHVAINEYLEHEFGGAEVEFVPHADLVSSGEELRGNLFFGSMLEAFDQHHPFGLRPEVLMHQIVFTVATAIKRNPAKYRHLFTTTAEGKELIYVQVPPDLVDRPSELWPHALDLIRAKLGTKVPPGIQSRLVLDFSTKTLESEAALSVAFMDAASPYYEYGIGIGCGLPEIALFGEAKDYRQIVQAAAQLAELFQDDLGTYFKHLLPVLDKIAAQAEGEPHDNAFWESMYRFQSMSGTGTCTGWMTAFVNYTNGGENGLQPRDPAGFDWASQVHKYEQGTWFDSIPIDLIPTALCSVPFFFDTGDGRRDLQFAAGPLRVEVRDGYLTPELSYAVLRSKM